MVDPSVLWCGSCRHVEFIRFYLVLFRCPVWKTYSCACPMPIPFQPCWDSEMWGQAKEKRHLSFWPTSSWVPNGDPGVYTQPGTQETANVQLVNEGRGSAWLARRRWHLLSWCGRQDMGRWLGDHGGFP